MSQRFVRLAEQARARVRILIDGEMAAALAGDIAPSSSFH